MPKRKSPSTTLRDEIAAKLRGHDPVLAQLERIGFGSEPRRERDERLRALADGEAVELPAWIVADALQVVGPPRDVVRFVENQTTAVVEPDGRVH